MAYRIILTWACPILVLRFLFVSSASRLMKTTVVGIAAGAYLLSGTSLQAEIVSIVLQLGVCLFVLFHERLTSLP